LDTENSAVESLSAQGFFEARSVCLWQSQKVVSNLRQLFTRSSSHNPERIHTMKSNLAIIEDNAKFNLTKSDPKPKVSTVAKGVKLPTLKESNPIFDRPFGAEGHTLGEAIQHQATVYNSIVKQRKGQLEKLKGIGEVLIELRSVSGASDKDYGKLVSKTPLAVMSRQDRSDAMWLAENWTEVQKFVKDMDISSGSAAYLRQQIRKVTASSEATVTDEPSTVETKTDTKPSAPTQSSDTTDTKPSASEASVEASTVESSEATVSVDDEESFALSMADIAKQSGLDLNKVIQALMMLA
jgi:hypothetical protein